MMKQNRWLRIYEVFVHFSVYPLLVLVVVMGVLTCGLVVTLAFRLADTAGSLPVTSARRLIPPPTPVHTAGEMIRVEGSSGESGPLAAAPPADAETASLQAESQNQPDAPAQDDIPIIRRRPTTAQPASNLIVRLVSALRTVIYEPTPYPRQIKILPSPIPTATGTPTTIPSPTAAGTSTTISSPTFTPLPTQLPTSAAIAAVEPAPDAIPVIFPTSGAIPVANPTFGGIPVIYPTPGSPSPPTAALASSPAISPTATLTPRPEYDFMLSEFFNSPTTNSFILIYVAIVDAKEIPIGDMKIVGTRLDHNLTYESPLSTWYYEGYNAPGQVIKSGNVKFEPPGGIESTGWVLHLEDAHGNRQSADVPFDVNENDKQWYFIKFRRRY